MILNEKEEMESELYWSQRGHNKVFDVEAQAIVNALMVVRFMGIKKFQIHIGQFGSG